ncbi:AAA family ATPase [Candidatus Woesearchaeota archaeon]|nr:AAA family ATPase [Candidatus Woesearchaeota archaeon]
MEQIKTGVQGMDELLGNEGFPKGRTILVSGNSGAGKTIFGCQFLMEGLRNNEPAVMITLEQSKHKLIEDMKTIGIDLAQMERLGKLTLIGGSLGKVRLFKERTRAEMNDIIGEIEEVTTKAKAQRVVLDSVNLFTMLCEEEIERRKALSALVSILDKIGCTTIFTCEVKEGHKGVSWHGFEEFVVDGVVMLYRLPFGNIYERGVSVLKMRGINHSNKVSYLQITNTGIQVYPDREPMHEVLGGRL